jgi:hypothetical protein
MRVGEASTIDAARERQSAAAAARAKGYADLKFRN